MVAAVGDAMSLRWILLLCIGAWGLLRGEDAFVPTSQIKAAARYSSSEAGASMIVVQHGKTLLREFENGHSNEPLRIFSGTKFFWVMAALCAQEDGLLTMDECVCSTITEWQGTSKAGISIRQLLNFTSGLPPMDELHEDKVSNRDVLAIKASLAVKPGSRFIYGPAQMQVFHELLRRKLLKKKRSPTDYLERRVLGELGLGSQRYVPDLAGNPLLAAGMMLTADQWLKVGKLLLRNGRPVISEASMKEALSWTRAGPCFGMGLWNNHLAATRSGREVNVPKELLKDWPKQDWSDACLCKAAPSDMIACIGSRGQRIYVVPSMELIVLRQGTGGDFNDGRFLRLLFGK